MASRNGAQRGELPHGLWAALGVRRVLFLALSLIVLQLAIVATASASSLYWYGENNSTCWQAGEPSASSFACDNVNAGFLRTNGAGEQPNMKDTTPAGGNGGIGFDVLLPHSGDYCNFYYLGGPLSHPDNNNESSITGYAPATPFENYQEGDTHANVCQAAGPYWGQELRSYTGGTNQCASLLCGMQHYVSFHDQGLNNRPWSAGLGNPSFVLSTEANPTKWTAPSAHGYVCPVLKDVTTNNTIEYCFQEWRSANEPEPQKHIWETDGGPGECNSPGGNNIDTLWTMFWPGSPYSTLSAGSAKTGVFTPGWKHFETSISGANLQAAIKLIQERCAGRPHSSNPADYALIGVEQGVEGTGSLMGASAANLKLRTEYTPMPPSVTTSAAQGVRRTQANLSAQVNPDASDTHYYFEYGKTVGYGKSVPAPPGVDIGAGTAPVSVNNLITGLEPGQTYHYRVVASNGVGSPSYGGDSTFTTYTLPSTFVGTPSAVGQENGIVDVFGRLANGNLAHLWYVGGFWYGPQIFPASMASDPSAVEYGSGHLAVFWKGTDGHLWDVAYSGSWGSPTSLGMGTLGGAPKAVGQTNGTIDVFWRGGDNGLYHAWGSIQQGFNGPQAFGGSLSSDPSAVAAGSTRLGVFWKGSDGNLWEKAYRNSAWEGSKSLGMGTLGGGPQAVAQTDGSIDVFWKGGDSGLYHAWGNIESGFLGPQSFGGSLASDPSPIVVGPSSLDVFWKGTDAALWYRAYTPGSGWKEAISKGSGPLGSQPVASSPLNGNLNIFWTGNEGTGLWSDWYTASNGIWAGPENLAN